MAVCGHDSQSNTIRVRELCEGKHVVRAGDDRGWFGNYRHVKGVVVVSPDRARSHSITFLPLPTTLTMSDSDGDFSDELLELAGATEKKRKRRERSSKSEAKRRKAE